MAYLTDVRIQMNEDARDRFETWAAQHAEDYDDSPLDPRLDSRWDQIEGTDEYIFSPKTRIVYSAFKAVELTEMFLMQLASTKTPFKAIFIGTDVSDIRVKTESDDYNFWAGVSEPVRRTKTKAKKPADAVAPVDEATQRKCKAQAKAVKRIAPAKKRTRTKSNEAE